jgi:hypothetical protein
MLRSLSIGRRMWLAFGVLQALLLLLAAAEYLSLLKMSATATGLLRRDAASVENAHQARASTLELRRFEKDIFLNVGSPAQVSAYVEKWKDQQAQLIERLDVLERLADQQKDRDVLRSMRRDAATYADGMRKIIGDIQAGGITTPQAGNEAVLPIRTEVRRLEQTAYDFALEHSSSLEASDKVLADVQRRTTVTVLLACVLAALASLAVGAAFSRSIRVPMLKLEQTNARLEVEVVERRRVEAELAEKVAELRVTLLEVRELEGILPVCAYCKRIRDDGDRWRQLEEYVSAHTEAEFSHGICPECREKGVWRDGT